MPAAGQEPSKRWLKTQFFLRFSSLSVGDAWSPSVRLSARFSLRDLPDFLDILDRGDLSAIASPLIWGPERSRLTELYARRHVANVDRRPHRPVIVGTPHRC